MKNIFQKEPEKEDAEASPHDPAPVGEEDLWFLPGPMEDAAPTDPADPPWPVAAREALAGAPDWMAAEQACYRDLIAAAEALARFGERLRHFPDAVAGRIALNSVSAVLRNEGIWIGPERIALYRALRVAGEDDARDLARAAWAMRRLEGRDGAVTDLHGFLGRTEVDDPQVLLAGDRPVGGDLALLGDEITRALNALGESHALTRAACVFGLWRQQGITPWDEVLEPSVAAMRIGAGSLAPFLPMAEAQRLDRHAIMPGAAGTQARLSVFCAAVEAGALGACMELDRLARWRDRAVAATADLSGRTPPRVIDTLLRYPVVSAELVADSAGCARLSARRNLNLLADRGLVREVTGQSRYRFWGAAL